MFRLPKEYADEMIAHAREENPNECCGILGGRDGVVAKLYRATNADHSPYRYTVAPGDLFRIDKEIRDNGWEWVGIYHSHTFVEAYPSATDVNLAFWPDALYFLVSLMNPDRPVVRAFHIDRERGMVTEEPLELVD